MIPFLKIKAFLSNYLSSHMTLCGVLPMLERLHGNPEDDCVLPNVPTALNLPLRRDSRIHGVLNEFQVVRGDSYFIQPVL